MNVVVKVRHMEVTEAIREYAQTKAAKLPRFYDQIQSIEVTLDMEAKGGGLDHDRAARKALGNLAERLRTEIGPALEGVLE